MPRPRPQATKHPRSFAALVEEELARVPARYATRVANLAVLVEDAPAPEVLAAEGLGPGETLLGLYHGVPLSARGEFYSGALPDTITLYRVPLMEEAHALAVAGRAPGGEAALRLAIRETLWHELGHYFGLDDEAIHRREDVGTNEYQA